MSLSERFIKAREIASISQGELAVRVGCAQSIVSKIESGEVSRTRLLFDFASELGVTADWLGGGKGDEPDSLRARLLARLKFLNLSQAKMAEDIHLENAQSITHWMARNTIPSRHLFSVSQYLDCDPEWLSTGKAPYEPVGDTPLPPPLQRIREAYDRKLLSDGDLAFLESIAKRFHSSK